MPLNINTGRVTMSAGAISVVSAEYIVPTPSVTPSISITPTPTITPTRTVTPSITPSITISPSRTPTPTPSRTFTPSTITSYADANGNTWADMANDGTGYFSEVGLAFSGNGATITGATFYLQDVGNGSGTIFAKVYSVTGTAPNNLTPNAVLASGSTAVASTIGTATVNISFSGANQIVVSSGTNYFITISSNYATSFPTKATHINYPFTFTSSVFNGAYKSSSGGAWIIENGANSQKLCHILSGYI